MCLAHRRSRKSGYDDRSVTRQCETVWRGIFLFEGDAQNTGRDRRHPGFRGLACSNAGQRHGVRPAVQMPNQQTRCDESRRDKHNSRCRHGDFPVSISCAVSIARPATSGTADEHIISSEKARPRGIAVPQSLLDVHNSSNDGFPLNLVKSDRCGGSAMGHEDQFPLRRPTARSVIRKRTVAATKGNGRDAL